MKKYLLALATVLTLSAFGCTSSSGRATDLPTGQAGIAPTATPTIPSSPATITTPPADTVYENASMKVSIPAGWTATEAVQEIHTGPGGLEVTTSPNPDAVNITKGKWILYINTNASQASGTPGGRFAEIAMGSPSADAVVREQPSECGKKPTLVPAYGAFKRADLFVSAADKTDWCATPTNNKTVWFFSYITKDGEYFNYYKPDQAPGLVITLSYNTSVVNDLPEIGSADLTAALKEMTNIASTLVVKTKGETK